MRTLEEHKVTAADDELKVVVVDEPGHGGASHNYQVVANDGFKPIIKFQNGPIAEHGVNGLTEGILIAIVIDRLRSFQSGKYACRENALALTKLEEAQHWMQHRTRARMRRNTEGTSKV